MPPAADGGWRACFIPQREIYIPISVPRSAEPLRVLNLLQTAAAEHPLVTKDPAPQALLVELDADTLKFRESYGEFKVCGRGRCQEGSPCHSAVQ